MTCTTPDPKWSSLTSENAENTKKAGCWADGRDHLVGEDHPFPKFLSLRSLCSLWLANCSSWDDPEARLLSGTVRLPPADLAREFFDSASRRVR